MTPIENNKLIYPELSYNVYGHCFKVHNQLGSHRSERSYGDALEQSFKEAGLPYKREISFDPSFTGEHQRRNIADFVIQGKIILDIKAKSLITKEDYYQMLRYLETGNCELGIIVNFRQKYLHPKRIVRSRLDK